VSYPQGPGQPGENPSPQYSGGPPQPGAAQYPQPPYPPIPAYPPQYTKSPSPAQYAAQAAPVNEINVYATQSLIVGGISLGLSLVALFSGYYFIGVLGLYAIYVSIRGLITAFGLRTHAGLIPSILGLFFSLLSLLVTLLAAGAFDTFPIPLLGG
jgi:hypothetical protein